MKLMETLNQCINAGHEMTKAIAIAQFNDDSPEARKITRRWRIGEAADLVGVSSQAIRDAEKAGRLPHPDMEIRGRVEQRVGYTIEQINHMRDVFGTRLRRAEDVFPPVIGVAAHKGGVYKTSVSVHLAQDLALKGLRVLLVEGNDPQGTASMYHGWVPDLHIHAEDTLLPFYLGEKDDVTYAIKPTCWPGLDIIKLVTLHMDLSWRKQRLSITRNVKIARESSSQTTSLRRHIVSPGIKNVCCICSLTRSENLMAPYRNMTVSARSMLLNMLKYSD